MLSNLKNILDGLDIPVAYHHFNVSTSLPYLVFLEDGTDNFYADNVTYKKCVQLRLELYTEIKQPELEEQLETILTNNEIPFEKVDEIYIESEKMFENIYQIFMY